MKHRNLFWAYAVLLIVFVCVAFFAGSSEASETTFRVRDTEGRETAAVLAKGLGLAVPKSSDNPMFYEPAGLSMKIDDSYWVCVPFSRIKSGMRVGNDEFVLQLSSATANGSVRGSLSPSGARIIGKFVVAGMTGDFELNQEKLSSITLVGDAPLQEGEDASLDATATIMLTNGKELHVTDIQRYDIYWVPPRYLNESGHDVETKKKDLVLVQGQSKLNVPFDKIKEISFYEKKVALTLVDGTSLQFDVMDRTTIDGFMARAALGSIYVTPEKIQKIAFRVAGKQQPNAK